MTIPIKEESEAYFRELGCYEQCCFCGEETKFWYVKRDVAVCPDCAKTHKAKEVPTKKEWARQVARQASPPVNEIAAWEEVVPRRPSEVFPNGSQWKVTARYTVHISSTEKVPCVRVRGYDVGVVLHYSETEFKRLFMPVNST